MKTKRKKKESLYLKRVTNSVCMSVCKMKKKTSYCIYFNDLIC